MKGKKRKIGIFVFCLLSVIYFVCFALFAQEESIWGIVLLYVSIVIPLVATGKSNEKKVKYNRLFTLFLTAISMGSCSVILFIINMFFVRYEWMKYFVLGFAVCSIILEIICFYAVQKEGIFRKES